MTPAAANPIKKRKPRESPPWQISAFSQSVVRNRRRYQRTLDRLAPPAKAATGLPTPQRWCKRHAPFMRRAMQRPGDLHDAPISIAFPPIAASGGPLAADTAPSQMKLTVSDRLVYTHLIVTPRPSSRAPTCQTWRGAWLPSLASSEGNISPLQAPEILLQQGTTAARTSSEEAES